MKLLSKLNRIGLSSLHISWAISSLRWCNYVSNVVAWDRQALLCGIDQYMDKSELGIKYFNTHSLWPRMYTMYLFVKLDEGTPKVKLRFRGNTCNLKTCKQVIPLFYFASLKLFWANNELAIASALQYTMLDGNVIAGAKYVLRSSSIHDTVCSAECTIIYLSIPPISFCHQSIQLYLSLAPSLPLSMSTSATYLPVLSRPQSMTYWSCPCFLISSLYSSIPPSIYPSIHSLA